MNTFVIGDSIKKSWGLYKKEWQVLLPAALIVLAVSYIFDRLDGPHNDNYLVQIVGALVTTFLGAGAISLIFHVLRGEKASLEDLLSQRSNFLTLLVSGIAYGIAVFVGFILLIVPGVYIIVRYFFLALVIVDQPKISFSDAFKTSGGLTKGRWWQTLLILIVVMLLYLAGFLLLGVGLLVTAPVAYLLLADYYEYMKANPVATTPKPAEAKPVVPPVSETSNESKSKVTKEMPETQKEEPHSSESPEEPKA